jgi:hypothetical protein
MFRTGTVSNLFIYPIFPVFNKKLATKLYLENTCTMKWDSQTSVIGNYALVRTT